jgi:hypothetical protein
MASSNNEKDERNRKIKITVTALLVILIIILLGYLIYTRLFAPKVNILPRYRFMYFG